MILQIESKRASTAIEQRASKMMVSMHLLLAALLLRPVAVAATVYSVGPQQPYSTIGEAVSRELQPGDEIEIHAKPTGGAYYEKFVINSAGTAEQPIVVRGIPDSDGTLPVIDGSGALAPSDQDYWNEGRSLIKIGGASFPAGPAAHIRIEGLQLRNAHEPYSYTDTSGASSAKYAKNAACIHVEEGSFVELVGNVISGCGNGIFVTPGVESLLIEGNHIYGNGNDDSVFEHNTYTEALGITYRYNRFGPLCDGCLGNNLKDRSGGLTVAYNFIEGGNRQLDLVDADDPDILASPLYRTTYVYGNILVEPNGAGNRQIVHYGGDSGIESKYRQGTLHFYHNTILSTRVGWTTFVRLSSEAETCDARNNIIFVTDSGNQLELLAENQGTLLLRSNWIKEAYTNSIEILGVGSVTDTDTVSGTDPGFADANFANSLDFRLSAPLPGAAILAPGVPNVDREYVPPQTSRSRVGSDLGAYGYDATAPGKEAPTAAPDVAAPTAPSDAAPPTASPHVAALPTASPYVAAPTAPTDAEDVCSSDCNWLLIIPGSTMVAPQSCFELCIPFIFTGLMSLFGWYCGVPCQD